MRAGDDVAYALIRSNAWNLLLSDTLAFDAGYGHETLFTTLTDTLAGQGQGQGTRAGSGAPGSPPPSSSAPSGGVVAPFQLVNHLPNSSALTHKAGLVR
jgi:hypothetical protein